MQCFGRKPKLLFEPFAGKFVQSADHGAFFGLFVIFGRTELGKRKTGKVGDPFNSTLKIHFFVFLNELENISACTTGKALINPQTGVYVHGWASVVMERAYSKITPVSGAFQRHKVFDDRRNICVGFELLDDFVRVECHVANLARKSHKKRIRS